MKKILCLVAWLLLWSNLSFGTPYGYYVYEIFPQSMCVADILRGVQYYKKLQRARTAFDALFFQKESGFTNAEDHVVWRGSDNLGGDLERIYPRMTNIVTLAQAQNYLLLIPLTKELKEAYHLQVWAPELLFQLKGDERIRYYCELLDRKIPIPELIKAEIEKDYAEDPYWLAYKPNKNFTKDDLEREEQLLGKKENDTEPDPTIAHDDYGFIVYKNDGGKYPEECEKYWLKRRKEAKRSGSLEQYKQDITHSIEKWPSFFTPVKFLCEVLIKEGKEDEAKAVLEKYYPEEKLIKHPDALKDYLDLHVYHDWKINENELLYKIFDFWFAEDPVKLANGNQYLWEQLWKRKYRYLRQKVREHIKSCDKYSDQLLTRLEEITTPEDFKEALREIGRRKGIDLEFTKGEEKISEQEKNRAFCEIKKKNEGGWTEPYEGNDIIWQAKDGKLEVTQRNHHRETSLLMDAMIYEKDLTKEDPGFELYPEELEKMCASSQEEETRRAWKAEAALLKSHPDFDDLLVRLPESFEKFPSKFDFRRSCWYLMKGGNPLASLNFLFKKFADDIRDHRISVAEWRKVLHVARDNLYSSGTNYIFLAQKDVSPDFLAKLSHLMPFWENYEFQNDIAAYYVKSLADNTFTIFARIDWEYFEGFYKHTFNYYGFNRASLEYLSVLSRKGDKGWWFQSLFLELCQKVKKLKYHDIRPIIQTDRSDDVLPVFMVGEYYEKIFAALYELAEKTGTPEELTAARKEYAKALIKIFQSTCDYDKGDFSCGNYTVKKHIDLFKQDDLVQELVSGYFLVKKNRALALVHLYFHLLDFPEQSLSHIGGKADFKTLAAHFSIGDIRDELKKSSGWPLWYSEDMDKAISKAKARNDNEELAVLKELEEVETELLEERDKKSEAYYKKLEKLHKDDPPWADRHHPSYPFFNDRLIDEKKEKFRQEEMEKEKRPATNSKKTDADLDPLDCIPKSIRINDYEEFEADWNGEREYLEKKREEAEKAKKEEDENAGNASESEK